jgi:hypothetical protein
MGRKKKPKPDDPEQYARFVETAERIQAQGTKEWFKEVVKRILSSQRKQPRDQEPE